MLDLRRFGPALPLRWVGRLGRNYADVTDVIREFICRGVIVRSVINGLTFDGASKNAYTLRDIPASADRT